MKNVISLASLLLIGYMFGNVADAAALSKEIAPDVAPGVIEKLSPEAKVYITGRGSKEIILIADPFCENSRKTFRVLQGRLEQIGTLKVFWVSAFPEKGSEVAAALAMRMQAAGKGEAALRRVFELDVPDPDEIPKARETVLKILNEKFTELGATAPEQLKPEFDELRRNTDLAKEIGYTGTPHFIVDGRVLHGHSGPAIRILLK